MKWEGTGNQDSMQASHVFAPGGPGCHTKLHSRWACKRRPHGTLVPKAFCFSRDVFLFFNQTQDLRAPSADRHETLPRDHCLLRLDNPGPKIQGALPKKFGGQKHAKFGPILYNFRLWSRISPERDKISTRSQAVASIADRTAKNCRGHVT